MKEQLSLFRFASSALAGDTISPVYNPIIVFINFKTCEPNRFTASTYELTLHQTRVPSDLGLSIVASIFKDV